MNPGDKLDFGFGTRLPLVLQTEAAECGLACLAMVAGFHGNHQSLPELRARYTVSLKGTHLARLMEIADSLHLQGRAVRLTLEQLGKLKTPCILHWEMNHFVVLKEVRRGAVVIHDPAKGVRKLSLAEVSSQFTGIALELTPAANFETRPPPPRVSLKQLTGPVSGLWQGLLHILVIALALQAFVLLTPFYMQWTVDHALASGDSSLMTLLGIGFLFVLVCQVAIGAVRSWAVVHLSTTLGVQWQANVVRHLLKLPLEYFEKRHLGDVVSRIDSTRSIQQTLSTSFVEAIIDGLMAGVTLAVMLLYSAKLSLVTLAATALYLLLRAVSYRPLRDTSEYELVSGAKQQSHLFESIRGMQSLKLAGREVHRHAHWQNLLVETTNRAIRLALLKMGFSSANQLLFGVERVLVIWIGALLVMQHAFSVGMLFAYLAYKDQFAGRVSSLIDKWFEFRMLRLHCERLADIVMSPAEETDGLGVPFDTIPASITVENVSFRYAEGEPWVVENCSFVVEEGESVAISGPSGCGKTTLVKIMLGLLKPSQGRILLGGRDIAQLGLGPYRGILGVVMQEDQLFAGSIADNIAFTDDEMDLKRVHVAARDAGVIDDIMSMPMSFNTLIGDMGTALSGGQKQRILLARALYRQPRVLFLDEATSHLDVQREREVNESIRRLEVTRIIIAHRPETLRSADRVLKMQDGCVVEEGGSAPVLDAAGGAT